MTGAMLGSAAKPFPVRTLMGSTGTMVKSSAPRMIANVPVIVVGRQPKPTRDSQRARGHGSITRPGATRIELLGLLQRATSLALLFGQRLQHRLHLTDFSFLTGDDGPAELLDLRRLCWRLLAHEYRPGMMRNH